MRNNYRDIAGLVVCTIQMQTGVLYVVSVYVRGGSCLEVTYLYRD
jgi:hypothetical protein